jgi:hypothetical protein
MSGLIMMDMINFPKVTDLSEGRRVDSRADTACCLCEILLCCCLIANS